MRKRKASIKLEGILLVVIIAINLASCNFPGLSPTVSSPEVSPTETLSPTETQAPEKPPPNELPTEEIPETTPTQTPPAELPGQCRPFPDQVYVYTKEAWLEDQLWVKCGGFSEPIPVRSPVEGLFWDYSNQTGKLVYGTRYTSSPGDNEVWVDDYTLWIYDFRTDLSIKWLQGSVLEAKWAPEVDDQGQQRLAVIMADGTVGLILVPDEVTELANIKRYDPEMDACCISWSPEGDRFTYVKSETLYVIPNTPQEPRMLAENAFGRPVWVMEEQLLLFPSSVLKVARADGSGPFIPNIPDGNRVWAMPESELLWDPENRMLVFDELHISESTEAITWVYSFSDNFETVIEQYSCVRTDTSHIISWYDDGKSMITTNGLVIPIRPSVDRITIQGVIDRIYQGRYILWLEDDPYPRFSVSLRAKIDDASSNRLTILDLKEGMSIKITGQSIADGCGFLAEEIQILED